MPLPRTPASAQAHAKRRDWRPLAGLGAGCLLSSLAWLRWQKPAAAGFACLAGVLLLLAVFAPRAFAPLQRVVDFLIQGLLRGLSWLLLGLVFVLCLVPGRLLLLVLRRDPLDRGFRTGAKPAWTALAQDPSPERFRRQF